MKPTASALGLIEHCRWLYRASVPWDKSRKTSAMDFGTRIHELAENYIEGRAARPATQEAKVWANLEEWIDANVKEAKTEIPLAYNYETDTARLLPKSRTKRDYSTVTACELAGSADLITLVGGHLTVTDFKSGAERDEHVQLEILGIAAQKAYGAASVSAQAVYAWESGIKVVPYAVPSSSKYRDLLQAIEYSEPVFGDHCDQLFCKARKVCPTRQPGWKPKQFSELIQKKNTKEERDMSRLAQVKKGVIDTPKRIMIYGVESVGKSTWASQAPSPIWLGADSNGTHHLDVERMPEPNTWTDIFESIAELRETKHDYKTLVVDPVNHLEDQVKAAVCAKHGVDNIEKVMGGFGKGWSECVAEWRRLTKALEGLGEKGMNVILIGHSQVKKFKSPDQEDIERYVIQMHDASASVLRQWVDFLFLIRIRQWTERVEKAPGRFRGRSDGQREVCTVWSPNFDAKSRPNLASPLQADYAAFTAALEAAGNRLNAVRAEVEKALEGKDAETVAKCRVYLSEDKMNAARYEEVLGALSEKTNS